MDLFGNIDFNRFLESLQYMWKGMLCIFIVMAVIILSVYVLNAIFGKMDEKKKLKEQQESVNKE